MKKVLIAFLAIFVLAGCSIVNIDKDVDNIISHILVKDNDLVNSTAEGYKYYLPRSVKIMSDENYNQTFYSDGQYMYLYVDVISYFYKEPNTYEESDEVYYSEIITSEDKTGYMEINELGKYYFVEIVYNYAKMEAYIVKDKLNDIVTNMCYILSTIKFNDSVIENLIVENKLNDVPHKYDIFASRRVEGNFLDVVDPDDELEILE